MSVPSLRPRFGAADPQPGPDPFFERPELVERYRALRALVDAEAPQATTRALLVVGVDRDAAEPATLLAVLFARAGRATALIDADLRGEGERAPVRQRLVGPSPRARAGLAEWLSDTAPPEDATPPPTYATAVPNLVLVPPGAPRQAAGDLLGGERLVGLLPAIRRDRERIVVVAPPLAVAADALPLARHVDAVVLVVSPGRTTGPAAARARDAIEAAGGRLLGVVLGD